MKVNGKTIGVAALLTVAGIAIFTALAHMSCIVLGESCFRAQLAPEAIVQSAIDGTWVASIGTTVVSALFVVVAAYAMSAAKLVRPLPLLKLGIFTISGLCMLRGAVTLPLAHLYTDKITLFVIVAGLLWFLSGALFILGYFLVSRSSSI